MPRCKISSTISSNNYIYIFFLKSYGQNSILQVFFFRFNNLTEGSNKSVQSFFICFYCHYYFENFNIQYA